MTRAEHTTWSKKRALEYLDAGDPQNAVTSMLSDLRKHPETANHAGGALGAMLLMGGHLRTTEQVRKFIEGFN